MDGVDFVFEIILQWVGRLTFRVLGGKGERATPGSLPIVREGGVSGSVLFLRLPDVGSGVIGLGVERVLVDGFSCYFMWFGQGQVQGYGGDFPFVVSGQEGGTHFLYSVFGIDGVPVTSVFRSFVGFAKTSDAGNLFFPGVRWRDIQSRGLVRFFFFHCYCFLGNV